MRKFILAFFFWCEWVGGCVRPRISIAKQTGKRKELRECSSSVPTFFGWASPLFVSSFFLSSFQASEGR